MTQSVKEFKLRLPLPLFEAFFRAFPGRGERARVLERVIAKLVERAGEKDAFAEQIIENLGGDK